MALSSRGGKESFYNDIPLKPDMFTFLNPVFQVHPDKKKHGASHRQGNITFLYFSFILYFSFLSKQNLENIESEKQNRKR